MKLELKTRQLPFHRKETQYYILNYNDDHYLYTFFLNNTHMNRFTSFVDLIDMYVDEKKKYNHLYNRLIIMVTKSICIDKLPQDNLIYAQKIGKYWFIINNNTKS